MEPKQRYAPKNNNSVEIFLLLTNVAAVVLICWLPSVVVENTFHLRRCVSHFQEANFHVARGCTKKTGRTRSPAVTCPAVTRMGHSRKCSAMASTASLLTSLDGQYEEVAISKHWGCHETPMKTVSINMSRGQFNKEIQVYFTS